MFRSLRAACALFASARAGWMPNRAGTNSNAASASRADDTASPAQESPPGTSLAKPRAWAGEALPWLVSMVVHAWVLLVLAWWLIGQAAPAPGPALIVGQAEVPTDIESLALEMPVEPAVPLEKPTPHQALAVELGHIALTEGQGPRASAVLTGIESIDPAVLTTPVGLPGGGLQGRSPRARAMLVKLRGGSPQSEQAVARGLRWLAAHQMEDGSWRLNHQLAPACHGLCGDPGNAGPATAATALALLSFLGAGTTHVAGEYQLPVSRGIYYLTGQMRITEQGGDLQQGTMYAQGLATIALCEAYAMSGDKSLRDPAQAAVDFIVHAQHAEGGWRYFPGQAGDTTVTGWQLMALKSAQMAGLHVPPATMYGAAHYLDTVQIDGGAYYGYQAPDRSRTNTAIGLLCRMYLGWRRDHEALGRGVDYLAKIGPSQNNMYFNYYAAQVLNHFNPPTWPDWNRKLREHLIRTQGTQGHESGSWQFQDEHTKNAGRLYHTAMAIMILEVYYRYLPLYDRTVLDEFP